MDSDNSTSRSFAVKDCALAAIATGKSSQNLKELRENLLAIHPESIYYHFWGSRLRQRFDVPEYNNDFANWALQGLRDAQLAERLSVIDPKEFDGVEALRQELVDVIEERLEESEHVPWSKKEEQFYFIRSQIVVFDTRKVIDDPKNLAETIPHISIGSIFYHFIDARRRTDDGRDDFSTWLGDFGDEYQELATIITGIDPYFDTLLELRRKISLAVNHYFREVG